MLWRKCKFVYKKCTICVSQVTDPRWLSCVPLIHMSLWLGKFEHNHFKWVCSVGNISPLTCKSDDDRTNSLSAFESITFLCRPIELFKLCSNPFMKGTENRRWPHTTGVRLLKPSLIIPSFLSFKATVAVCTPQRMNNKCRWHSSKTMDNEFVIFRLVPFRVMPRSVCRHKPHCGIGKSLVRVESISSRVLVKQMK